MKTIRQTLIPYHVLSLYCPNENPSEDFIREVRRRMYQIMHKKLVPERLHDHATSWVVRQEMSLYFPPRYAKGHTPLEIITGETPDITEYLDFGFYD